MMFILPLGILTYWWDRRNYTQSLEIFRAFISRMRRMDVSDEQKLSQIDAMFYQNGYVRVERSARSLVVEKKHFNIGLLFICFGILTYFGLALYLIYYRFFQKPRRLIADLGDETMLRQIQ